MRILSGLLSIALLMVSVGCSAVQSPTATVRGASLGNVDAEGMMMNLDVMLSNPNPVRIPITKTGYSLSLAGKKVFDGTANENATTELPASGSASLMVPVRVRWSDLMSVKDALSSSGGDVPYRVDGTINVSTGLPVIGDKGVPLHYEGMLPLKEALRDPTTIMKSPVARELAKKLMGW